MLKGFAVTVNLLLSSYPLFVYANLETRCSNKVPNYSFK